MVCFFCHAPSLEHCAFEGFRVHSSNKHCIVVYRQISTRFSTFFSEEIALSDALHSSHFLLLGGATIFAKLRSKIVKSPKNRLKSLCAPLRTDS